MDSSHVVCNTSQPLTTQTTLLFLSSVRTHVHLHVLAIDLDTTLVMIMIYMMIMGIDLM